jgi:stage III sporulation protein AG
MDTEKAKKRLKKLVEGGGALRLLIAAGAVGAALIMLSGNLGGQQQGAASAADFSVTDYRSRTQRELEELLSHIQGAGRTRVLLTMENSAEAVYLENAAAKTKEIEPRVRGVLVLCEGGGDAVVAERVTEAVTKALDISTAKVCIAKLSE